MQFKLPQILKAIDSSMTSSQTSECGEQCSLLQFEQLFKDQNTTNDKSKTTCSILIRRIQKQNQQIWDEINYCQQFETAIKTISQNIQSLIYNQRSLASYIQTK
ncbi:Hypothetical_protein [Hexamita inflata]|uniref:Hypothetical_protein n=1 Tax=Hexamita inflata TaxID=28002 RepID=A0AA86RFE1_9EUKA|nr:Hypothetical protein HINF_LOCUS64355 [Hexamita inflata]